MRNAVSSMAALLVLAGCSGSSQTASSGPGTRADSSSHAAKDASYLFVQEATSGAFKPVKDTSPAVLVLWGGKGLTTWFTDRPVRDAGVIHTDVLVAGWSRGKDSFKADPPNAALVVHDSAGEPQAYAMEILAPIYEPISKTVAYQVRPLASGAPVTAHTKNIRALSEIPARFRDAALFIDPSDAWCEFAYGVTCAAAACMPQFPAVYNQQECAAQYNALNPPPPPPPKPDPPLCSDGTYATGSSGSWTCKPPATVLNCEMGQNPTPLSFVPPLWMCESSYAVRAPGGFGVKATKR